MKTRLLLVALLAALLATALASPLAGSIWLSPAELFGTDLGKLILVDIRLPRAG